MGFVKNRSEHLYCSLKYYRHEAAIGKESIQKKNVVMSGDFAAMHADNVTRGQTAEGGPLA